MQKTELVIFDLDGTLLNTISDLACCTNHALILNNFPTHPIEAYKYFVGNGINKLFERSLPADCRNDENIALMRQYAIPYYELHCTDYTKPYPGIPELLKTLSNNGIKIAVASNKFQKATNLLIRTYFPDTDFVAVFGQREGIPIKPDPAVVHEILNIAGTTADRAVYIGDSGIDMQTASNSGVRSIGVTWGFRPREELETYGANAIVDTATEIAGLINF